MGKLLCRICFERDGVVSEAVVEHVCTNEDAGKRFFGACLWAVLGTGDKKRA
jgi:hypothetical protein